MPFRSGSTRRSKKFLDARVTTEAACSEGSVTAGGYWAASRVRRCCNRMRLRPKGDAASTQDRAEAGVGRADTSLAAKARSRRRGRAKANVLLDVGTATPGSGCVEDCW